LPEKDLCEEFLLMLPKPLFLFCDDDELGRDPPTLYALKFFFGVACCIYFELLRELRLDTGLLLFCNLYPPKCSPGGLFGPGSPNLK